MSPRIDLDLYDFPLPPECIAQQPSSVRDAARLMRLARGRAGPDATRSDLRVRDLPALLDAGDLLVVNRSRVLPARLRGHKRSGGAVEALLLGRHGEGDANRHRALLRSTGRQRVGLALRFERDGVALDAEVAALGERGEVLLAFAPGDDPYSVGEAPLPPYIRREGARGGEREADLERYQTVYAREGGSVAAPTAGLHLTRELLARLADAGIGYAEVTLHVGLGTFRPLAEADLAAGRLHRERYALPPETASAIEVTRARGGRVVAVGTTTARVLESARTPDRTVRAQAGETDLFLFPGKELAVVDALLTNFHLPRSSLLLLVAAFAGREPILAAYARAVKEGFRFYSYGDAMLIL